MSAGNRPVTASAATRSNLYTPRDLVSALASIIGFRDRTYRRRAVNALALNRGNTVVEIGCGTGRNFVLLEEAVGPAGRLIAIDTSLAMLARAQQRVTRHGWKNVELVHGDVTTYEFPADIDGVLATYSLVAVPAYDDVVQAVCRALKVGKRCTVLDQKLPSGLAARLVPIVAWLSRSVPYRELAGNRRVWESIQRYFDNLQLEEFYFGFVYVATGEKRAESSARTPIRSAH